jgi:hypothetical protein
MANNETLGASFSIDVTELKAGLSQANRMIRESESEFKAAAAGMDDWRDSEEGLTAKIKSLNSITDLQKKKVGALQAEYDRMIAEGLDPTSKAAVELRTKINNETAALNKNEAELKKQKQALEELGDESNETAAAVEETGGSLEGLKAAGSVAVGAIAAVGAACVAAIGAFFGLAESTREARTNMARLQTSFESAGHSAEAAESTFTELYGILGDDGAATEAAQQLAKISKNEKDLEANTRILTGVMAEYGSSIPTESLAEGMAATAAMGSVQGTLADALEWQGVNLDDYNAKLATLTTEEERAAYIQSTLTDLYGESADAYRENNAEVIAAQKAQAELNNALNELGAIAEPIMTTLKQIATDLLVAITPFVKLMGEGLAGALNGTAGAADSLAEGLSGILTTLVDKVVGMLPFVIETVVALVPQLVGALVGAIMRAYPTILDTIVQFVPQLVQTVLDAIPSLLRMLLNIAEALIEAIAKMLPSIIDAIMELLPTLINTLISSIPDLLQAAITLLMAIVDALPVIINELIAALPSIIETTIAALLDAIPMLYDAAIQLMMAIVDAIPTIIDTLIENLPTIVSTVVSGLIEGIPKLIAGTVKFWAALIKSIPEMIPTLVKAIPEIISAIVGGLLDGISDIGAVGKDIVEGLWNGIKDMGSWISKKIKGFGESVLGGIKDFFGIHSPSKVMADEVGKNLALGIGEGFEENIAGVNNQITGAMNFDGGVGVVGNIGGRVGGVVVNQYNTYSQSHSRIELYKTKQATAAAVRLAMTGA